MKKLFLFTMIFTTIWVNAQQQFDVSQPASSIKEELEVINSNKCIQALVMNEYYSLKQIAGSDNVVFDDKNIYKSALFFQLFKEMKCSNDDIERFHIITNNWYIGMQRKLLPPVE